MRQLARSGRVLTIALCALVVTACGGGGDTTSGPTAGPTSPGTAAPSDDDTVTVPDSPDDGVTTEAIKIAWLGDVTGPTASVQSLNLAGSQAYVDWLNSRGGLLGREVELVVKDDQYSNERGTLNVTQAIDDDRVLTFVGLGDNGYVAGSIPKLESSRISVIGPGQSTDYQMESEALLQNLAHYGDMADIAVARMVEEIGDPSELKVLVVRLNVPSGGEWTAYIQQETEEVGGTYVGEVIYDISAPNAEILAPEIAALVASEGVNYLAVHGIPETAVPVMDRLAQSGTFLPMVGIQGLASPSTYTIGPPGYLEQVAVEGVHSFLPANVDSAGSEEIRDFVAGTDYEDQSLHINFTHGWVNVMVFEQAAHRAAQESGELTRESLYAALRSGPFDVKGLTCPPDWSSSTHVPCGAPFTWDGSGLTPVAPFDDWAEAIDGEYGVEAGS